MQFLTIHHSLNQIYNVEKSAIEQVVQKAVSETKNIKAKKIEVSMMALASSVTADIIIIKKKDAKYEEVITKLYTKVEQYIENLVGAKAKNIRITVSENY